MRPSPDHGASTHPNPNPSMTLEKTTNRMVATQPLWPRLQHATLVRTWVEETRIFNAWGCCVCSCACLWRGRGDRGGGVRVCVCDIEGVCVGGGGMGDGGNGVSSLLAGPFLEPTLFLFPVTSSSGGIFSLCQIVLREGRLA